MVTQANPLPLSPTIATLAVYYLRYACGAPIIRLQSSAYSATAIDWL